jgi:Putative transposase
MCDGTWGSAMTHHPHLHMIVPGGGLSEDGSRWVPCRPNFLPVRVLSRLFRRLFLRMLTAAHEANRLKFFGNHASLTDPNAFAIFLAPLKEIEWVVYAKEPFAGREPVLRYLSRYTHRVAISAGGWSRPTTAVSPSAGRTIGSMDPFAGRR